MQDSLKSFSEADRRKFSEEATRCGQPERFVAQAFGAAIRKAETEGRDEVTVEDVLGMIGGLSMYKDEQADAKGGRNVAPAGLEKRM